MRNFMFAQIIVCCFGKIEKMLLCVQFAMLQDGWKMKTLVMLVHPLIPIKEKEKNTKIGFTMVSVKIKTIEIFYVY